MCGRFTATSEFSDIRVRWNLDRNLMRTGLLLFVVMMASIGWSAVSVAQPLRKTEGLPKLSPELWKKTQEAGTLRVIVDLNVPGWTSKPATQQAEHTLQQMISDTQEKVIAELTGTVHKITRRFYLLFQEWVWK